MSKRYLRRLVDRGRLCRRLGRSPHAHAVRPAPPRLYARMRSGISCERIGVAKADSVRWTRACWNTACAEDLNAHAPRLMGVLRPAEAGDRKLSRRTEREMLRGGGPARQQGHTHDVHFSPRACISSRTISWRWRRSKKYFRLCCGQRGTPEKCLYHQV